MAFEHKSGLPDAFDRAATRDDFKSVVFYGRRPFIQGAELNEMQTVQRGVHDRVSRLVARDGDRIEHANAFINRDNGTITLTAGTVFISGDVLPVGEAVLSGIPMTGRIEVGVKLTRSYLTAEDDPTLLGLVQGSLAEGEAGAARELQSISWALEADAQEGDFFAVYIVQDGSIIDQAPPSNLEPVMQQLASYDRPHGHYVVSGCRVTALGKSGDAQEFSIEEGEANIWGFKRTRQAALRLSQIEDWDEGAIPGETHEVTGSPFTFEVAFPPIGAINSILLTKQKTVNVTRGATANGLDALPDSSVIQIVSVAGYSSPADYKLTANSVDWSAGGSEPSSGATYSVTYRYRDSVSATAQTAKTITVTGGVSGGDVIVAYQTKMPRVDRIGLREDGSAVYIRGVSAMRDPSPPVVPANVLPLALIRNNWMDQPEVENDAVRSLPYGELWRFLDRIDDLDRLLQLERIKSGIDAREPVAKKGMFVDPFADDSLRDAGAAQTAAIGNNIMQLAITPTIHRLALSEPVCLNYVEEIVASQDLRTACVKINPYANFAPLPAAMEISPPVDFWTEDKTEWASAQTLNLNMGFTTNTRTPLRVVNESVSLVSQRKEQAEFLRQIAVSFTVRGFGAGENLTQLTFDSINVLGAPLVANGAGVVSGSFNIPANITAGTKEVRATGQGGSTAVALFTGAGTINVDVMRRVTTVQTWTLNVDPQAQVFTVPEPRQIIGVDVHFCAIGDTAKRVIVEQVGTDNGYPTTEIAGQASLSMTAAAVGWRGARYDLPVTTAADRLHAFVVKTDDSAHSISTCRLGDFDTEAQRYVSSHPYTVGPRFDSVNGETWTPHQGEALSFKLVAAKYTETSKTVDLGTINLVACSDIQVRAIVELPSAACSVYFEIERANGTVFQLLPFQLLQLNEALTETVAVRAILSGTAKLSPILYAPIEIIAGAIASSGTYVSRAMTLGSGVKIAAYLKAFLPSGAAVTMDYSVDGGGWVSLPYVSAEALDVPQWTERKFEKPALTGTTVRLRVSITGGPSARPIIGDFGAGIY